MMLWLCPLFAFLLGSIPFGLIIARMKGIDIRAHGSGNIGATNVLRIVGRQYGIACLFLDLLKGLIPTLLGISLICFVDASGELNGNPMAIAALEPHAHVFSAAAQWKAQALQVLTGLLAILGHNYSPWVGFKGGKGIATSAGVLIALMPFAVILLVVVWLATFFLSRYVSLASIVAAAAITPLMLYGSWHHQKLQDGTWNKPLFVFTLLISFLAIWKHRTNIQRLRDGTEHRFERKKKRER